MGVSPAQIAIVLVIALLIFGARRVPEAAPGLGRGLREFRGGLLGEPAGDPPPAAAGVGPAAAHRPDHDRQEAAC